MSRQLCLRQSVDIDAALESPAGTLRDDPFMYLPESFKPASCGLF
jgi:hypothetical protein